ncbi:NUDIX hydrolase [Tahibacter amnicola]|uniref:Phosphatase NudJ n=1 Tax=Tahibacter amnicola TaxID=2976241 RepID=A0ABY6BN66_9GAMM|nr:NUDIX hydrolase [Tahibacter amnicola]UXI70016.1 NUDIX hydrolase [Tahibacter amnicola]
MTTEILTNGTSDETIWRPHVTVATIVPRQGRFLLVEENIRGDRLFNQPAGHLEAGESLAEAAVRETLEETGWEVTLDCLVGVHQWVNRQSDRHFVRFTFAATPCMHHASRPLDVGIERIHWLGRQEIAALGDRLRSPLILSSIDAWLGGQRLPLTAVQSAAGPT